MKSAKESNPSRILASNVRLLAEIEEAALCQRTFAERWCDGITRAAGEFWFAVSHAIWFSVWVVLNVGVIPGFKPFDPFPFAFLTFVVSLEAIFLSLTILMSQRREDRQTNERAKLDLQINLLAEREATKLLQLVRALCAAQGLPEAKDPELRDLLQPTNPEKILRQLEDQPAPNREVKEVGR